MEVLKSSESCASERPAVGRIVCLDVLVTCAGVGGRTQAVRQCKCSPHLLAIMLYNDKSQECSFPLVHCLRNATFHSSCRAPPAACSTCRYVDRCNHGEEISTCRPFFATTLRHPRAQDGA